MIEVRPYRILEGLRIECDTVNEALALTFGLLAMEFWREVIRGVDSRLTSPFAAKRPQE
jgi:hypothetical protein